MNYPEKAAIQYAQIQNVCYPGSATSIFRPVDVYKKPTTNIAEADQFSLKKINLKYFQTQEAEKRIVVLVHEASHNSSVSPFGKGKSGHGPDFWEEFASNLNTILESEKNQALIESVFKGEIDWHRVRYRAIQNVSQVDRRSETIEERKEKLATAISGYDVYSKFEGQNVGFIFGEPKTHDPMRDPAAVSLPKTIQPARDYSDETLIEFMEEFNTREDKVVLPTPAVWIYPEEFKEDAWQQIKSEERWEYAHRSLREPKKALALMDRLGTSYYATSMEHVLHSDNPHQYNESVYAEIEDFIGDEKPRSFKVENWATVNS